MNERLATHLPAFAKMKSWYMFIARHLYLTFYQNLRYLRPAPRSSYMIYVYNQNGITIYNAAGLAIEKAWCITELYIEKR